MKLTDLEKINRLVDERLEVIQLGLSLGRLGPAEAIIEVGRFPIIIEGKQIAEYDDLECQLVHRAYSYRKIETGDDVEIVSAGASP